MYTNKMNNVDLAKALTILFCKDYNLKIEDWRKNTMDRDATNNAASMRAKETLHTEQCVGAHAMNQL
jgi:hypothetical protein